MNPTSLSVKLKLRLTNHRGFSLLEVTLAMSVSSILLLVILQVMSITTKVGKHSTDGFDFRTKANVIKSLLYNDLNSRTLCAALFTLDPTATPTPLPATTPPPNFFPMPLPTGSYYLTTALPVTPSLSNPMPLSVKLNPTTLLLHAGGTYSGGSVYQLQMRPTDISCTGPSTANCVADLTLYRFSKNTQYPQKIATMRFRMDINNPTQLGSCQVDPSSVLPATLPPGPAGYNNNNLGVTDSYDCPPGFALQTIGLIFIPANPGQATWLGDGSQRNCVAVY
jgi:prepilin-type N-terminal cleavage/methylation domain-containing protein